MASVWPEFAAAGKGAISFAEILSHRAGLAALDDPPDVFDYPAVIHALENQRPLWPPGSGHGYHPRTSGYLWDEVVRRRYGPARWRRIGGETFAEPLGLDFWIGLAAGAPAGRRLHGAGPRRAGGGRFSARVCRSRFADASRLFLAAAGSSAFPR